MKSKVNIDLDEFKEGVSYEKGREFEKQFASFMKQELKWSKVRIGAHMPGKHNAKGTSIDVFGERLSEDGIKYEKYSTHCMYVCILGIIFGFLALVGELPELAKVFLFISTPLCLFSLLFYFLNQANNKENSWVECKNLKSKVDINHMSKMLREFNDYRSTGNKDHTFTHLYFASANGYVENALKMAMDNKVTCFVKKGNSFEVVKYWDEK